MISDHPYEQASQRLQHDDDAWSWLQGWQSLIRDRDLEAAHALFVDDVIGFGTIKARANGLSQLALEQWSQIWPHTRDFSFHRSTLSVWACGNSHMLIAVQWSSTGIDAQTQERLTRKGRASIALSRDSGSWKAFHTHFSLDPAPEPFLPASIA